MMSNIHFTNEYLYFFSFLKIAVLTRSREDLEKTYNYLTEVMGLEGSRSVLGNGSGGSRSAHENRHSTKLRLIASPAWRLPLRRTTARHSLLLFSGQWPPSLPRSVNSEHPLMLTISHHSILELIVHYTSLKIMIFILVDR